MEEEIETVKLVKEEVSAIAFIGKWIIRVRNVYKVESYMKDIPLPVYPFVGMRVMESDFSSALVAECVTWLADIGIIQVESTLRVEDFDSVTILLADLGWIKIG